MTSTNGRGNAINEFAFYQEFMKFIRSFKTKKACAEYLGISRVHLYDLINKDSRSVQESPRR